MQLTIGKTVYIEFLQGKLGTKNRIVPYKIDSIGRKYYRVTQCGRALKICMTSNRVITNGMPNWRYIVHESLDQYEERVERSELRGLIRSAFVSGRSDKMPLDDLRAISKLVSKLGENDN